MHLKQVINKTSNSIVKFSQIIIIPRNNWYSMQNSKEHRAIELESSWYCNDIASIAFARAH